MNENPIDPGIYTLYLISSVNGCEYTHDFIIPEACPEIDVTRIPGTCTYPYNGTVEVTISGGTPPYEVYLGQDGAIASEIYTFAQTGTYIIETNDDFNPNHAFSVILNDSDSYYTDVYVSSQPAMHFQWSPYNVYTTYNLTEELYQDMIICIGNANDQTLNISHDVTFNNCHIYTNTQGSDDTHYTIWKIFYDDQINMESGHLHIINGTTIESGCPDKMWQGIEARGEYNVNCETMLIDIVDSKISDAMHAIKLWGNVHLNADNSTFENNRIDINLNQWGWGIANFDHTYINNNIFQTTRSLNNSMVYPKAHVYLKWASDITFKNNEFINSTVMIPNEFGFDEYTVDKRGKGIEAVFSSFIVTPVSNKQYVAPMYNSENYFEGLFYAIDVRGQKNYAPKVYHSDFVNNFRGIHFRGTNGSRILFNEINTTNADVGFETNNLTLHNNPINGNVSYGVYIDRGLNTLFEENTIYNGKAGSYIFSTGNSGTRYYRNKFGDPNYQTMGMEAATIVVGRNSNWDASNPPTTNTGLEIRCNNYIANNTAISVLNGNMRKNQGVLGGNTDQLAGNQFHSSFTNGTEFKVQIHENIFGPPSQFSYLDLGVYNYYQHDDGASGTEQNGYHRRLLTYSDLEVDPQTQDDKRFYESEACESHYSLPVVHDPDVVIFDISFQTNTLETLENQYDEIIDRGDTEYMISVAEELDPHNFRQYTTILSNDGYLSDQVFLTLLDNHVAQKPVIAAILIANSPLPEDILDEVNNSTYLDNGHKNKILKYQEGTNPRLLLEYEMADVKQEIIYLESELVNNAINNDSIIGVKEIAINYFNSKPIQLVKDLQTIYNLSISSNDYTTAENSLSDLRIIANTLSEDEAIEVIRFCDVNQLYISALNDTANYSLLYDNREFLLEAARSTSPSYSVTAEILYSIVTDSSYFEYTPLPVNEMGSRSIQINNEITKDVVNNFDIYTNPVLNTLNIYFDLSATCEDGYEVLYETIGKKKQEGCSFGEILIYTSDAKLIETIPLESITGTLSIDIESYKPGVYLIEIDNCYGDKRTKKITKTQ
ncbi:MAG: hypothetical protein C0596_16030 [Marinilabiliales bacterium]|nr:MAG: hypothetical protein C0596_16030 [Marinilabiliales bacterium]